MADCHPPYDHVKDNPDETQTKTCDECGTAVTK
jgi:hypothetical protein